MKWIILILWLYPILTQAQNNAATYNVTLSREKIKTGFTFEKEVRSVHRFGLTLNYGYSQQDYPNENSSKTGGMFELPYMDNQEHLYAGYVNSTSNIQAFITELNYTQLIGGKLPNSTSGFGIYIRLGYGRVWDNYVALFNSYKYGDIYVKDTYQYNCFNGAAGFNYRLIKKENFIQLGIGPNFYYPMEKLSAKEFIYSRHAPFVSTEYELKFSFGRKF